MIDSVKPLAPHRVEGRLDLAFERSGHTAGRTVLRIKAQQPPLKVIRSFNLADGGSLVHLHNISGGVLGGDRLEIDVTVGIQAHAQITTPSATRIYRCPVDKPASHQITTIAVDSGGLLELLPDPLIPFGGSAYRQDTRIDLAADAGLFWWETVAPGREARGETFDYRLLALHSSIQAEGQPIALESIHLTPGEKPNLVQGRLGPYRYFSTFYICRVGLSPARWTALESELMALATALSTDQTVWGVSTLIAHGVIVRALGQNNYALARGLFTFWNTARQALYGRSAIPPRKVY